MIEQGTSGVADDTPEMSIFRDGEDDEAVSKGEETSEMLPSDSDALEYCTLGRDTLCAMRQLFRS